MTIGGTIEALILNNSVRGIKNAIKYMGDLINFPLAINRARVNESPKILELLEDAHQQRIDFMDECIK